MTASRDHLYRRFIRAVLDAAIGSTPFVGPALSETLVDAAVDSLVKSASKRQDDFAAEAERAGDYLANASGILSTLQTQLDEQRTQLSHAVTALEATKAEAEHYATLADAKKDAAEAFVRELEERIRRQFEEERKRHVTLRRIAAITLWVFSLMSGAIAGVALDRNWERIAALF